MRILSSAYGNGYTRGMAMTADEMGRKRWKGVPKKERQEHAQMLAEARMVASTPESRTAIAKKAAAARWAKKAKAVKKVKGTPAQKKSAKKAATK